MVFDPSLLPQNADALDELVLASRLLGGDESLVLHGGGNTSVKAPWRDITGRLVDAIYVKGSGWDLATIDRPGFAPMPIDRLHHVQFRLRFARDLTRYVRRCLVIHGEGPAAFRTKC